MTSGRGLGILNFMSRRSLPRFTVSLTVLAASTEMTPSLRVIWHSPTFKMTSSPVTEPEPAPMPIYSIAASVISLTEVAFISPPTMVARVSLARVPHSPSVLTK